ncbi:MAG: EthD family reductase [Desulfobacterales bacterium]|nr:EthD family reductase [Desulfobacterales bacterium]
MIKVSVLYPNREGVKFDMDYYLNSHIPMVRKKLGPALKGVSVEKGLGGPEPGSPPLYVAMCHLTFDSVDAFQAVFAPNVETFQNDVPNYTDIEPTVQVSEVKL